MDNGTPQDLHRGQKRRICIKSMDILLANLALTQGRKTSVKNMCIIERERDRTQNSTRILCLRCWKHGATWVLKNMSIAGLAPRKETAAAWCHKALFKPSRACIGPKGDTPLWLSARHPVTTVATVPLTFNLQTDVNCFKKEQVLGPIYQAVSTLATHRKGETAACPFKSFGLGLAALRHLSGTKSAA